MLEGFFLTCAIVGGALVATQVLMSVMAFRPGHHAGGHHHHHLKGGGHHGGARGGARGGAKGGVKGGAHGGAKAAAQTDPTALTHAAVLDGNANPGHLVAHGGALAHHHPGPVRHHHPAQHADPNQHSAWLVNWLHALFNFQGIVAGLTILGMAGMACLAGGLAAAWAVTIGAASGLVMMILTAGFLESLVSLDQDATMQLDAAVGHVGTVYLSIPASAAGQGKITMNLQQRTMEFPAITHGADTLPAGRRIIVVDYQDPDLMEVVAEDKYIPPIDTAL